MPEIDIDLDRKIAKNWKEYLKELANVADVVIWVWKEFVSEKGKKLFKKLSIAHIISCAVGVASPWFLSLVFAGLNPKNYQMTLVASGLALYGLFIIFGIGISYRKWKYWELMFGENLGRINDGVSRLFFEKSLGLHYNEYSALSESNIHKGYERIEQLQYVISNDVLEVVLTLFFSYIALWYLDFVAAAVASIMLIVHFLWTIFINQKMMEVGVPIDREWRALNRYRVERMELIERVKTNAKEEDELVEISRRFGKIIKEDRGLWLWRLKQIFFGRGAIDNFLLIIIMLYGARKVWIGEMNYALLFPLFTWANRLAQNLWQIGEIEYKLNFITPAIMALKKTLTMPVGLTYLKNPKHLPADGPFTMEFEDVSFCYGGGVPVLKDVSFSVGPGEKVAVIGNSGAGKTTLKSLAMRYMDPTKGNVFIKGVNLKELDPVWVRNIGYVPQKDQIFDGTIRYNILYGLSEKEIEKYTDDEIWQLVRSLQGDFGLRLVDGLDTIVGRNGIKLSGGQAQRLMLIAAVKMRTVQFMIIDEATSSLDATTERLVQEGLRKVLTPEMGAIIITHRWNTVRRICNKFILIGENGGGASRIEAAAGSLEELIKKSSLACSLAKDQGIVL